MHPLSYRLKQADKLNPEQKSTSRSGFYSQ